MTDRVPWERWNLLIGRIRCVVCRSFTFMRTFHSPVSAGNGTLHHPGCPELRPASRKIV